MNPLDIVLLVCGGEIVFAVLALCLQLFLKVSIAGQALRKCDRDDIFAFSFIPGINVVITLFCVIVLLAYVFLPKQTRELLKGVF